jgi:hypothetical protein
VQPNDRAKVGINISKEITPGPPANGSTYMV